MYTDKYPKSRELNCYFTKITFTEDDKEEKTTLIGDWYIHLNVPEKIYNRTEEYYEVISCTNNNFNSYEPYPKNPKITKVFKEIGLTDELGSDVRNIMKYTKIYSGRIPELKEDDIFTTIIPLESDSNFIDNFTNIEIKILDSIKKEPSISQSELSEKIKNIITNVKKKIIVIKRKK